jgi:flagellar biosynthesis protein FliR
MAWLSEISSHHVLTFALVLVRVLPLVMIAPIFGSSHVPARVRVALGLALALLIVPVELAKSTPRSDTFGGFTVLAGAEALIGLTLGLGILLLFASMHVAGQLISQMSGMHLAEVFDPGFETSQPVFSQLLTLATMAVFFLIGGHRKVMEALLDTFAWLPAGQGMFSRSVFDAASSLLTQSFALGIRAAAPAMVSLLLATLILGLVSRTLPQLNVMALGFGINALVGSIALGASLGAAVWVFQEQLEPFVETMLRAIGPGSS